MDAETAKPMSFDAANRWLASRVSVPTVLTSRQLAITPDFDAQVRMRAFFSATVDKVKVLDTLRTEIADLAAGDTDRAAARVRIKTALARQGYSADDVGMADKPPAGMDVEEWKKRKAITNLASTRRLDLILNQNARMAWAIGRKEISQHPAVMERWPNYRYIAREDDATRPDHAALNGLVLPKADPFWHTHTPPWDFNCRCDIEDEDGEATGRAITSENPDGSQTARIVNPSSGAAGVEILPSQSGYVFRSDAPFGAPNWDAVPDGPMKRLVMEQWRDVPPGPKAQARISREIAKAAKQDDPPATAAEQRRETLRQGMEAARMEQATEANRIPEPLLAKLDRMPSMHPDSPNQAYYSSIDRSIHMNPSTKKWHGTRACFHHEFGHHVHYELKLIDESGMTESIRAAVNADKRTWVKANGSQYVGPHKAIQAHMDRLGFKGSYEMLPLDQQYRIMCYFDTVGGLTRGKMGFGHSKAYYGRGRGLGGVKEAFANCYAAEVMGYKEFAQDFPKIVDAIKKEIL